MANREPDKPEVKESGKQDAAIPKEIAELKKFRQKLAFNLLTEARFRVEPPIAHWEELSCVGYNPAHSMLEAVVSIKQQTDYSGGLCPACCEYVRFFVDWGTGFQNVGLTSFAVGFSVV